MSLEEFYNEIGGNYNNLISRLKNENLIVKFLKWFLQDESFNNLKKSVEAGDLKQAFVYAHTLKGLALTLELGDMIPTIQDITEKLRNSNNIEQEEFNELEKNYNKIISSIKML